MVQEQFIYTTKEIEDYYFFGEFQTKENNNDFVLNDGIYQVIDNCLYQIISF